MPDYTLTYSPDVQGWPSFYSFHPDFMIGMNNYFYSFKGGNLYRHNTNDTRNQFYGTNYPSTVKSVFNGNPTENTLWKTIELESDNAWATQLQTNIQSGVIASTNYKKKEAVWFAFVRNTQAVNPSQFVLRSVNGLGNCDTVDSGDLSAVVVSFTFNLGTMISIGDYVWSGTAPTYVGQITAVDQTNNTITVDTTVNYPFGNQTGTAPVAGDFILYAKDITAESHGVLGAYCVFDLELEVGEAQNANELFLVEADIMKSYP